jgi:hypothetical protein
VLELGEELFDWVQGRRVFGQKKELDPGCAMSWRTALAL